MASGEFLEIAQRAARAARYDPSNTTDLTRAKEAVNQAYLSSCASGIQYDFLEDECQWDTTAGSDKYSYTSIATAGSVTGAIIGEILSMVIDVQGESIPLESMDWIDLERLSNSTQDSDPGGTPVYWAKWGAEIRLYPNPDNAYTLGAFMRLVPSEMSADGDTPLIPLAHRHSVIVSAAAANLLRQEGGQEAHQEAVYYDRQHEQAMTSMRTAHATARLPTFRLKSSGWDRQFSERGDPFWSNR